MSAKTWKAVIVDDERLARNKLRQMLAAYPQIEVVGEADGVEESLKVFERQTPDVVFLDVQMPGESGFELLSKAECRFKTIFVTAFDEYAIRAFEVNALDYLLKPIKSERLARAIERLATGTTEKEKFSRPPLEYDDHLFLTIGDYSRFVKVNEIKCIAAADIYSEVYMTDGAKLLTTKSLSEWAERLPQKHFLRIHRSTIINIEHVEAIKKWFNYSYQVQVRGITEPFVMSRRYAAKLKDAMS
jgi:two-component system, LytTR family, response regulator